MSTTSVQVTKRSQESENIMIFDTIKVYIYQVIWDPLKHYNLIVSFGIADLLVGRVAIEELAGLQQVYKAQI